MFFFNNRNSVIELVNYFRVHIDTIFMTDFQKIMNKTKVIMQ